MSDCEKGNSWDEDLESDEEDETNEIVNPVLKFCHFLTETGHSLNFVLVADNMTDSEVSQTTKLIHYHFGTVSTSKKDVSSHSAVLVADDSTSWDYCGEVFKLSYIHDCIAAGKVLNIGQYVKDPPSKLFVRDFNYMNVIYHRMYSWETIPSVYKLPKPTDPKPSHEDNDSDASIDSLQSLNSTHLATVPRNFKQTKQMYTEEEKEAMLRYVVEHKYHHRVKGKKLYREMEAANICPIRTWQSMKDHFLRCMSKELSRFKFLTSHQRKQLQDALYPYR